MNLPDYHVESELISNLNELKKSWISLQNNADCSFFQSWGWIGNWLEQVAMPLSPRLVCVYRGRQMVGLGIFITTTQQRHKVLYSRIMFLNEAPFDGNNMIVEYNGLLAARHHEAAVYRYTLEFLLQYYPGIDEFFFGALSSKNYIENTVNQYLGKIKMRCQETSTTWLLTLNYTGNDINAYLATLGKNRRLQIKRSLRLYEQESAIQIEEAQTVEQALLFMDGLKVLHTRRWQNSGKTGSFANKLWQNFHHLLISSRFRYGEIQLLRIFNANAEIGYLYNFIWQKHVYVLQTGFVLEQDKRLMPGYVSHTLAITYNKNRGMKIYDLMHGNSLYKSLLCNQSQQLYWLVLQRKKIRFLVEDLGRFIKRKLSRF